MAAITQEDPSAAKKPATYILPKTVEPKDCWLKTEVILGREFSIEECIPEEPYWIAQSDLMGLMKRSKATVSYHIGKLMKEGKINTTKRGKKNYFQMMNGENVSYSQNWDEDTAYIWDIDGVITQTHNSLNIEDQVSVEEAVRRIKSATPFQATIDMIKNLMSQAPKSNFMALTGRKRSQFAEYTEEFFRVQGIEMDVIYYPEHEEHTPEIYYEFKRQELDWRAATFKAIHYFEDDANMVKYLRSNLKNKERITLWLIQ